MAAIKNENSRVKLLLKRYATCKRSGLKDNYYITLVDDDDLEHYYILIKPIHGIYKDQTHIIEMKTRYGQEEYQYGNNSKNYAFIYPQNPPMMRFLTSIYHTNISTQGSICLDTLKSQDAWAPSNGFDALIYNILLLLELPNNSSPFNSDACILYVKCEKKYNDIYDKKMSIDELEELKTECFKAFTDKANAIASNNRLSNFAKWFPFLADKNLIEDFRNKYNKELEEMEHKVGIQHDVASTQNDITPTSKKQSWAKYKK